MTMTSVNRIDYAKLVVESLVPLVERIGTPVQMLGFRGVALEARINGIAIMLSRAGNASSFGGSGGNLLDLWGAEGGKVLSVRWDPFKLVRFERGPWTETIDAVIALRGNGLKQAAIGASDPRVTGPAKAPFGGHLKLNLLPAMGMVRHIVVDRSDVEACNTDDLVQVLSPLVADAEAAWKLRGKLSISFHGYDEDPRALYTVPDVRKFVARVNAVWPHWFFFLNQVDHSIKLIAACLCELSRVEPSGWQLAPPHLAYFLETGMASLEQIFERHRFPPDQHRAIVEGVIEYLRAELG
jgi:hypothetical protein